MAVGAAMDTAATGHGMRITMGTVMISTMPTCGHDHHDTPWAPSAADLQNHSTNKKMIIRISALFCRVFYRIYKYMRRLFP